MKGCLTAFLLLMIHHVFSQQAFQLAPPLLNYKSAFFSGSTSFEVQFNQPGARVYYTLDGNEPTEKDKVYTKAVSIRRKTTVRVRAMGKGFQPSETVTAVFIPGGKQIQQVSYSMPNESYANASSDILYDHIGGIANFRHGSWLGYNNDTATFEIVLAKSEPVKEILFSILQDENSWIFLPKQLNIYAFDEGSQTYHYIAGQSFQHNEPGGKRVNMQRIGLMKKVKAKRLKVVAIPLNIIPEWHSGKGEHGWFFIDEIKVY